MQLYPRHSVRRTMPRRPLMGSFKGGNRDLRCWRLKYSTTLFLSLTSQKFAIRDLALCYLFYTYLIYCAKFCLQVSNPYMKHMAPDHKEFMHLAQLFEGHQCLCTHSSCSWRGNCSSLKMYTVFAFRDCGTGSTKIYHKHE